MKIMKFIFSLFFSFVLLNACAMFLSACSGCDPAKEFNNGSSTPSDYNIGFSGTAIATAIKTQLGGSSSLCDPPQDMTNVRVRIQVRTAMTDNAGNVVLDPKIFFEKDREDIPFFSKDEKTKINIKVPSTGSFGITIDVELPDCSNCCNAIASGKESEQQCFKATDSSSKFFQNGGFKCKTGKPKIAIENIYSSATRPDFRPASDDLNIIYRVENMLTRSCRSCETCINNCN
jgi:hypothetical protein